MAKGNTKAGRIGRAIAILLLLIGLVGVGLGIHFKTSGWERMLIARLSATAVGSRPETTGRSVSSKAG